MATAQFRRTGSLHPRRNAFDLSYSKLFTCRMGELIPVFHDEMVPGDTFQIGNEVIVRFQPMVAPILHEITVYTHYFFVPYRILWEHWERFITGGIDGQDATPLPRWPHLGGGNWLTPNVRGIFSLWDYFGFPINRFPSPSMINPDYMPLAFPLRAYNLIYDEYYRDENLESRTSKGTTTTIPPSPPSGPEAEEWVPGELDGSTILDNGTAQRWHNILSFPRRRNWTKDYFTSALPWQLRGTPPALPIAGNLNAEFAGSPFYVPNMLPIVESSNNIFGGGPIGRAVGLLTGGVDAGNISSGPTSGIAGDGRAVGVRVQDLNRNTVDLSEAVTFDVSDLRRAFQLQKWMERNARAGVRYTEFLRSHFGVSPRDDRLNRPEYIGGSRTPVTVSEVLQTSQTNPGSPQGTMSGHGLEAGGNYVGSYKAYEFGIVMGLMSVMPKPAYEDGINRQWLRRTRYDYYFPEFSHLSEQGLFEAEIFAQGVASDYDVWGFQGIYDEMRVKQDMVCSEMRVNLPAGTPSLSFWHLGRSFASRPPLNASFVRCEPALRPFAVQGVQTRPLIVHFGNKVKGIRPLPEIATPGLIDHF